MTVEGFALARWLAHLALGSLHSSGLFIATFRIVSCEGYIVLLLMYSWFECIACVGVQIYPCVDISHSFRPFVAHTSRSFRTHVDLWILNVTLTASCPYWGLPQQTVAYPRVMC